MGFPSETLTIGSLFNYVLLLTNFLLDVRVVPKSDFDKNRNLFFCKRKIRTAISKYMVSELFV